MQELVELKTPFCDDAIAALKVMVLYQKVHLLWS